MKQRKFKIGDIVKGELPLPIEIYGDIFVILEKSIWSHNYCCFFTGNMYALKTNKITGRWNEILFEKINK